MIKRGDVIRGKIKCNCGLHDKSRTHGKRHTRLYDTWSHMKARCYNKNDKRYVNYGKRGITICDEWLRDFQVFYDWAINHGYNDTLTIDRINVNGNYEPNNCRFVDIQTQQRNKINNKLYTLNGVTKCLSEWCEVYNINYFTVRTRLKYNWSIKKALTIAPRKVNKS